MKELFFDFAHALEVGLKNAQLYGANHPRSLDALKLLTQSVERLTAENERVQVVAARGRIFLEGQPIDSSPQSAALLRQLDERKIGGFTITRGARGDELQQFIRILHMKPDQIEARGGASQLLADADVTNIRLTRVRYEELLEGEEIVPTALADGVAGAPPAPIGGPDDVQAMLLNILMPLLQSGVAAGNVSGTGAAIAAGETGGTVITFPTGGPRPVAPLGRDALAALETGVGGISAQQDIVQEAIRQTVETLTVEQQWALLLSIPQIQNENVRDAIEASALDMMNRVLLDFVQQGGGAAAADAIAPVVEPMLAAVPQRDRALELVRARLVESGISREQLAQLLAVLAWENVSTDEKLAKLLDGNNVFRVPQEKVLTFIRHLLGAKRHADALRLLEVYARGLFVDSSELRLRVAAGFAHVTGWVTDPGVEPEIEALLEKALLNHFMRETDPGIQQKTSAALENLLGAWLVGDRVDRCYRVLIKLNGGVMASAGGAPWKREAYEALVEAIVRPERFVAFLPLLYEHDAEVVAAQIHPFLALVGDHVAGQLFEALSKDEDRAHRARLVRAIKAVGRPALQHLAKALASPTWYVVRNAVTILGDLTAVDLIDDIGATLKHDDARVRRAAARSLSRLGGLAAEGMLLEALPINDAETQVEILHAIGALRVAGAVPLLGDFVRKKRATEDRVRERAIEALGHIGSEQAIPILTEVVRKKGLLATDTPEMRAAAARALVMIGTDEAMLLGKNTVEAEPKGA
ncbi:MAG: HEAT repeat domain-containing protein, partial [Thermoanaerobaculia bacterium]